MTLTGFAQSNERVSELLRNVGNNSQWISAPELVEIRAVTQGGRDGKRLFQFTMNVTSNRPRDSKTAPPAPTRAAVTSTTIAAKP